MQSNQTLRMAAEVLAYLQSRYDLTITRQTLHNYANPNKGLNCERLHTTTTRGPNGKPIRVTTKDDVDLFVYAAFRGTVTPR